MIKSKRYNDKLYVCPITFTCFLFRGRISVSLDIKATTRDGNAVETMVVASCETQLIVQTTVFPSLKAHFLFVKTQLFASFEAQTL